ncbi:MAG: NusG domain II-containing protein [Lachnospiraceae bacterium]|nr:NusG domain II-containing protein [Lachnospiraceae bacterium]
MKENPSKKAAVIISVILAILFVLCLYIILSKPAKKAKDGYTADIYTDGELIKSIDLSESVPQTLMIGDESGSFNEIEVTKDGKIGVVRASCPDKLCIHQGFANTGTIPIVCLPNRLTIVLRSNSVYDKTPDIPDVMTYD